jgi:putative ABC transport system permease protein
VRKVTLRSLWSHKRRLLSTVVSVLLGVAFMCGTLVFTDTIDQVFDDLFAQVNEEIDTVVQGDVVVDGQFGGDDSRIALDESLVEEVRSVDGVAAAEPFVGTASFSSKLLDTDGDAVGPTQGPPTLLESWVDDEVLNPYELTEGSAAPAADDEVAINVAAADDGGYEIGDTVAVYTQEGIVEFELVGTFLFGTAESSAGAISLDFTLATAARLTGVDGSNTIYARGEEGVSAEELTDRVAEVIPEDAEALTGVAFGEQTAEDVSARFSFFTRILVVFAGIALLVGSFIIYNTFQILLAQRTRELALLRAIGASRRQVLSSVILEAVVIATVAAGLGVLAGVALASAVFSAFASSGADLPTTSVTLEPGTLLWSFAAGAVVTLLAALVPAIRATRVPPLAAMRDVAVDRSGASRIRLAIGAVLVLLGAVNLGRAWTAGGDDDVLPPVAFGALLLLIGAVTLGPVLAGPSARALGSVAPRLRGVAGRLARENAVRSPKRTSATASALVITVALIGFITTLAASMTESVKGDAADRIQADVVLTNGGGFNFTGFSPTIPDDVAALPGVAVVSTQKFTSASVAYPDGDEGGAAVGSIEPSTFGEVADAEMEEGSLDDLTDDGVMIDRQGAQDHDVHVGDTLTFTFPGGDTQELEVQGITDDLVVLFPFTITDATFVDRVPSALDFFGFVGVADGADAGAVQDDIEALTDPIPLLDVLSRDEFLDSIIQQIAGFLTLIYALLALSIVISLIGIANTLSLSIHERTREIGLLRAVGATRGQLRASMRWEAGIIAVLGTLVGLALGLVCSWAIVKAMSAFGLSRFEVPYGSLVFIVAVGGLLGVVASLLPARRAARLDILDAIAHD